MPQAAELRPYTAAELKAAVLAKLTYAVGKAPEVASPRDWFLAVTFATRDIAVGRWLESLNAVYADGRKRVYYLSLEFLIGRLLFDAMTNLGVAEPMAEALDQLGVNLADLRRIEPDAALGNGGLGRLAACFMDSMATLSIAAHGYGIRYDNGLFRQIIRGGWQQETPEDWLVNGNPWEFVRPEYNYAIGFGGWVEMIQGDDERSHHVWHPAETVEAVAYDTPIVGWRGRHVNTLRLWSARATDPLKLEAFNAGDYVGAFSETVRAEAISKVLYPSDATPAGQELRLRQEYFFASASLLDLIRRHIKQWGDVRTLGQHSAVQLNDTHPAIGIAELMRILVDLNKVEWDEAWTIVQTVFSYTNHTLLPEALETWSVPLMERVLPRHMQIIYLVNAAHLDSARRRGFVDQGLLASISMIDEQAGRRVKMGNLAFVGSHKINGVSALHTDLMRKTVFQALNTVYPDRITNKTNGITFRRWLIECNPGLADIIRTTLGERALDDYGALKGLVAHADDPVIQDRVAAAHKNCKAALARTIADQLNQRVDLDAMFDVQVKRIHEYKRQLLNILETVARYNAIRANPTIDFAPRVKIFAGKAAASYTQAKLIIKLAIDVAKVVNSDPTVRGLLKVVFLPNYNVSLAEIIMPAADLSEQISTAGMEASGTGNMKMALNGALTVGTLDGANVEMRDLVGDDNIFIFGLTAAEVEASRAQGIDSTEHIAASAILREALDEIGSGVFSTDDAQRYRGLVDTLTHHDYFMVCADFDAYWATQIKIDEAWRDRRRWVRSSILNTANVGWFSSDRTISEYAKEIWNAPFAPIS
ncbi:MAG TPA: glycogen/starch/alpha-glucan phosphorylase [Roseiarcus sp.]